MSTRASQRGREGQHAARIVSIAWVMMSASPGVASSVFTPEWTGFYLGGSIGARKDVIDWTALSGSASNGADASLNAQTARIGGFAGLYFQFGSLVLGIEGDLAWGKNSGLGIDRLIGYPSAAGDQMTIDTNVDGSIRARAGVLVLPTLMLYGTGGIAYEHLDVTAKCTAAVPWCLANRVDQVSSHRVGLTLGGGVETLLLNKFTARVEYRWTGYSNQDVTLFSGSDALKAHLEQRSHIVSVGLAYKF